MSESRFDRPAEQRDDRAIVLAASAESDRTEVLVATGPRDPSRCADRRALHGALRLAQRRTGHGRPVRAVRRHPHLVRGGDERRRLPGRSPDLRSIRPVRQLLPPEPRTPTPADRPADWAPWAGAVGWGSWSAVLVALVGLGACGSDGGAALAPIPGDGTIAMPRRPVIVDPLPAGWSVRGGVRRRPAPDRDADGVPRGRAAPWRTARRSQSPRSASSSAKACALPSRSSSRPTDVRFHPNSAYTCASAISFDKLISFEGERDASSEEWGFVLGRDLDEPTAATSGEGGRLPATDTPGRSPQSALPDGFQQYRPSAGHPQCRRSAELIELTGRRRGWYGWLQIGAYDGDAASDALARFWGDTVVRATCSDITSTPCVRHRRRDERPTCAAPHRGPSWTRVAAGIRSTDAAGLARFSGSVADAPPTSFLSGCQDADPVIDGTRDRVRWIVGFDRQLGPLAIGLHCVRGRRPSRGRGDG